MDKEALQKKKDELAAKLRAFPVEKCGDPEVLAVQQEYDEVCAELSKMS